MDKIDWKKCLLCQTVTESKGPLIINPRTASYERILGVVEERASLLDGEYVNIQKRLNECTKAKIIENRGTWHRLCYSEATNEMHIQRSRDRMQCTITTGNFTAKKPGQKRTHKEMCDSISPNSSAPFTRSATEPLDKQYCFFCQTDDEKQLFAVRTDNAGRALQKAVELSMNPNLMTRLNNAISPSDAHAIDVLYHKSCWRTNVFHVIREAETSHNSESKDLPLQLPCLIELINLVDIETQKKSYLPMDSIESMYVSMLGGEQEAEKHRPALTRKWLKDKILSELPNVKSVRQKDQRKPSVLYSPDACEKDMVHNSMRQECLSDMDNVKLIYKTAKLIRNIMSNFIDSKKQLDSAIKVTSSSDDVPLEIYSLIRWILVGPEEELQTEMRKRTVDQSALTVCQNIMYAYKSKRQVQHKPKGANAAFRHMNENPQVVGLGLTIHNDTRNKQLIELLHAQNYSISYKRALALETSVANAVVEITKNFDGLYVPPFLKKGVFLSFAVDNTDFSEDTADGKHTTHGTITAVYQMSEATGEKIVPELKINEGKSLSVNLYHVPIRPCNKPKPVHATREQPFQLSTSGLAMSQIHTNLGWIFASALTKKNNDEVTERIPSWTGYNSLLSVCRPLTQVGALPLLPEVAHEWPTMLTVILQTIELKNLVVGEEHPAVITFDMALYEKVVQLLDARPDLKAVVVPRLGELHTVMAALRALGTSIENSGIDDAWIESDVYGSSTVRQILKCTHYKRSLTAHIRTYMAFYEIVLDQFFHDKPHLKPLCTKPADDILNAFRDTNSTVQNVKAAHEHLLQVLTDGNILQQLETWESQRSSDATFRSVMNYLHRVETILVFIAATRNSDLQLHLEAGGALSKLFFAYDRIKYKRLWPRYLADMQEMETKHPKTWQELKNGNLSVTKSEVPFVSIGADHACEHINKMMKVHSGLIGISNNANARQRFFMAAPEMAYISADFKGQFDVSEDKPQLHHNIKKSVTQQEYEAIGKIKAAILSHGNPLASGGDQIYNFITHAYVPKEYVKKILEADKHGQELYESYVTERINGGVGLWEPLKKEKNMMYMSGNRKQPIKIRDKTVDLKETKDLYGRLLVLTKSNRDVDQKNAIGSYEFTLTPRALFAPDGSVLPCTDKSKLIHCLQKFTESSQTMETEENEHRASDSPAAEKRIAIIDGMVVLQKVTKIPATVKTVRDLGYYFNEKIMTQTRNFDEVIIAFDTYKTESLKQKTREKRRQGKVPVQYQIIEDMKIAHIPMKRLLSHEKTKSDLTMYLADIVLKIHEDSQKLMITSAAGHTRSNNKSLLFEDNNHEEADTLMIWLAVKMSERSPDAQLVFFTPDTDVLILLVSHFDKLCKRSSISMVSGLIEILPIWQALGPEKARALAVFHALTGNDNIGRFSGIGKTKWFQQYVKAENDVMEALMTLTTEGDLTLEIKDTLAKFVCSVYCPRGVFINSIPELRWYLFCKHLAESNNLPPTTGALEEHIKRVRIQSRTWYQADRATQELLNPLEYGYYEENGQLMPMTTLVAPAPQAITELVRCQCKTNCSSHRCSCRRNYLPCTELCLCETDCENNMDTNDIYSSESDDDV